VLQEMVPLEIVIPLSVLGVLLSFVLGRLTATSSRRVRELQSTLDDALAEREQVREESAAVQRTLDEQGEELTATRKEGEDYRVRVSDHFTETSHRLHELTLQYRAVYDHLAAGASELCPEGFEKLEGGLGLDALPETSAPRAGAAPVGATDPAAASDDDSESSTAEARGGAEAVPDALVDLGDEDETEAGAGSLDTAEPERAQGS